MKKQNMIMMICAGIFLMVGIAIFEPRTAAWFPAVSGEFSFAQMLAAAGVGAISAGAGAVVGFAIQTMVKRLK